MGTSCQALKGKEKRCTKIRTFGAINFLMECARMLNVTVHSPPVYVSKYAKKPCERSSYSTYLLTPSSTFFLDSKVHRDNQLQYNTPVPLFFYYLKIDFMSIHVLLVQIPSYARKWVKRRDVSRKHFDTNLKHTRGAD